MIRTLLLAVLSILALSPAWAQEGPLDEYVWVNRVVVIFADSDRDPRFSHQIALLEDDPRALEIRDIVVLLDTERDSPLRQLLRPRDFTLVLIDKDGSIVMRKPSPMTVRELSRLIDKMPSRIEDIAAGAPR